MTQITAPRPDERLADGRGLVSRVWMAWVSRVTSAIGGREPRQAPRYTVANLPPAASWAGCDVHVSNEVGGYVPAFSDGTHWRRVTDRAIVS